MINYKITLTNDNEKVMIPLSHIVYARESKNEDGTISVRIRLTNDVLNVVFPDNNTKFNTMLTIANNGGEVCLTCDSLSFDSDANTLIASESIVRETIPISNAQ